MGSGRHASRIDGKGHQTASQQMAVNDTASKISPLCEVAHISFRSVRVIHRLREREAHAENHTKD
jgi:hypothetical protein